MRAGLFFAMVLGCGGAAHEETGFVLLDHEARAAGVQVEASGWRGAPVLPIALDAGEPIPLRGPRGASVLELRPGFLAWVRGPEAAVDWLRLGADIRDDVLQLDGTDEAA